MLSKKVEEILNSQIEKEFYSSNLYLAMASWCENEGLHGCASFLYKQAEEETGHMLKFFKYVNESAGRAIVPSIKQPPQQFKSLANIFEASLEHEIYISSSIHKIVELCHSTKDYATLDFLQWFVSEQREEESSFRSILDMVKLAGGGERSQFFLDHQIAKLKEKKT